MSLSAQDFTDHKPVKQLLNDLRADGVHEKAFSDLLDHRGNQYVDLVMEGGGVLGIALVGYVYVLEQMNLRFLQLGGTSAGSINTLLMAAGGPYEEARAEWLLDVLAGKDLSEFMDGDQDAQDFTQALLEKSKLVKTLWKGWQVIDNFTDDQGLHPGDAFYNWIKRILKNQGIENYGQLKERRAKGPKGLYHRETKKQYDAGELEGVNYSRIALVTADVTTQSKIVFPEMAELYWEEPEAVNPAKFVRASMSIPLFFKPMLVRNLPHAGEEKVAAWMNHTSYEGTVPKAVKFVDGGTMSNFPINLFHDLSKIPYAPTFGVKLGVDRQGPSPTDSIGQFLMSIFDASRQVHDFDFLHRNPDYRQLVCYIETGKHNWLNFKLTDEDKIDLFLRGAQCGAAFLRKFDWSNYKATRSTLSTLPDPVTYGNVKAATDRVEINKPAMG